MKARLCDKCGHILYRRSNYDYCKNCHNIYLKQINDAIEK